MNTPKNNQHQGSCRGAMQTESSYTTISGTLDIPHWRFVSQNVNHKGQKLYLSELSYFRGCNIDAAFARICDNTDLVHKIAHIQLTPQLTYNLVVSIHTFKTLIMYARTLCTRAGGISRAIH